MRGDRCARRRRTRRSDAHQSCELLSHHDPERGVETVGCLVGDPGAEPVGELGIGEDPVAAPLVERAVPGHVGERREGDRAETGVSAPTWRRRRAAPSHCRTPSRGWTETSSTWAQPSSASNTTKPTSCVVVDRDATRGRPVRRPATRRAPSAGRPRIARSSIVDLAEPLPRRRADRLHPDHVVERRRSHRHDGTLSRVIHGATRKAPASPTVADQPSGTQMVQSASAITRRAAAAGATGRDGRSSTDTGEASDARARTATTSTSAPGRSWPLTRRCSAWNSSRRPR